MAGALGIKEKKRKKLSVENKIKEYLIYLFYLCRYGFRTITDNWIIFGFGEFEDKLHFNFSISLCKQTVGY